MQTHTDTNRSNEYRKLSQMRLRRINQIRRSPQPHQAAHKGYDHVPAYVIRWPQLSEFLELDVHLQIFFRTAAETFKNATLLCYSDFGYSIRIIPLKIIKKTVFYRKISFFILRGLGYPKGRVPIFKIGRKDCIFERFSIWQKKYENMSF